MLCPVQYYVTTLPQGQFCPGDQMNVNLWGGGGGVLSIHFLAPCPADCLSVVISSGWPMSPFNSQILDDERVAIEGLLSVDLTYAL